MDWTVLSKYISAIDFIEIKNTVQRGKGKSAKWIFQARAPMSHSGGIVPVWLKLLEKSEQYRIFFDNSNQTEAITQVTTWIIPYWSDSECKKEWNKQFDI